MYISLEVYPTWNSLPLKIGRDPKGKVCFLTTIFQGRFVSFRECITKIDGWKMMKPFLFKLVPNFRIDIRASFDQLGVNDHTT